MAHSKPSTWLFLLIIGAGVWTDIDHLIRGNWDGTGPLYAASCAMLIVSLLAFARHRPDLTKWTAIGGLALIVVGTILK